jgi:hypothetical protein
MREEVLRQLHHTTGHIAGIYENMEEILRYYNKTHPQCPYESPLINDSITATQNTPIYQPTTVAATQTTTFTSPQINISSTCPPPTSTQSNPLRTSTQTQSTTSPTTNCTPATQSVTQFFDDDTDCIKNKYPPITPIKKCDSSTQTTATQSTTITPTTTIPTNQNTYCTPVATQTNGGNMTSTQYICTPVTTGTQTQSTTACTCPTSTTTQSTPTCVCPPTTTTQSTPTYICPPTTNTQSTPAFYNPYCPTTTNTQSTGLPTYCCPPTTGTTTQSGQTTCVTKIDSTGKPYIECSSVGTPTYVTNSNPYYNIGTQTQSGVIYCGAATQTTPIGGGVYYNPYCPTTGTNTQSTGVYYNPYCPTTGTTTQSTQTNCVTKIDSYGNQYIECSSTGTPTYVVGGNVGTQTNGTYICPPTTNTQSTGVYYNPYCNTGTQTQATYVCPPTTSTNTQSLNIPGLVYNNPYLVTSNTSPIYSYNTPYITTVNGYNTPYYNTTTGYNTPYLTAINGYSSPYINTPAGGASPYSSSSTYNDFKTISEAEKAAYLNELKNLTTSTNNAETIAYLNELYTSGELQKTLTALSSGTTSTGVVLEAEALKNEKKRKAIQSYIVMKQMGMI